MNGTSDVTVTQEGDRTVMSVLHCGAPVVTLRMTGEQALTLAHDLIEQTTKVLTRDQRSNWPLGCARTATNGAKKRASLLRRSHE